MPSRARSITLASLVLALAACHQAPVTTATVDSAPTTSARTSPTSRIERLDPALDALIPRDARVEKLADGFAWTEGPIWRRENGGYLLFSDAPNNTIWRWRDGEGVTIYLRPAGYPGPADPPGRELGSNGLTTDAQGRLVIADHGNRQIARLREDSLWTKLPLATNYQGKRFNSPNDLIHRANGDLFFTDPPYGLRKLNDDPAKELPFNGVFKLSPSGTVTLLPKDLAYPNGIALSPDGNTLYVGMSDAKRPQIVAYDIQTDGTLAREHVFFDAMPLVRKIGGWLDGMKVDAKGNVFTSGPGGILVLSPQGKHLGTIVTGDTTANCAFGGADGSTLYMTTNHSIMRIRTSTKGLGF